MYLLIINHQGIVINAEISIGFAWRMMLKGFNRTNRTNKNIIFV
jgi:hypothetical protein